MALRFQSAGATDVGREREANEDAYALVPDHDLWVLADGMGGHASGQVASKTCVDAVTDFLVRWRHEADFVWPFEIMESRSFDENSMINAIRVSNVRVYNRAQVDESCKNMGTTVVSMQHSRETGMIIGHVGDSRCYRLRDDHFVQLTEDHSLVRHLMNVYHLSEAEACAQAGSNVIVRAVGLEDDVEPEIAVDVPRLGDLYMTCSDGLTDLVDDWIIQQIISGHVDDPAEAAQALVRAANQAGGTDNITVVIVKVVGV